MPRAECWASNHFRAHHRGLIRITGPADHLVVTDAAGRALTSASLARPPTQPPPDVAPCPDQLARSPVGPPSLHELRDDGYSLCVSESVNAVFAAPVRRLPSKPYSTASPRMARSGSSKSRK